MAAGNAPDVPVKLVISKFVLRPHGRSLSLTAKASFPQTMPVDPDQSGMTVEVDAPDGQPVYTAVVPPEQFGANFIRTRFLFVADGPAPAPYAGLRSLKVTMGGSNVVVTAKAVVPASALSSLAGADGSASTHTPLNWAVRWGAHCASSPVLCSKRSKCQPM